MESLIEPISKEVEINCNRCGFKGLVTATKVYYIDCPECNELVYVGHLTGKMM